MSRLKLKTQRTYEVTHGPKWPALTRRAHKLPAVALVDIGPCAVCLAPLMVAVGQRIRFHKQCRNEGRKRFGRSGGIINEKGEWVAQG